MVSHVKNNAPSARASDSNLEKLPRRDSTFRTSGQLINLVISYHRLNNCLKVFRLSGILISFVINLRS